MSTETTSHSPEFEMLIKQVETALILAAADAKELAERTGTPLITRKVEKITPFYKLISNPLDCSLTGIFSNSAICLFRA